MCCLKYEQDAYEDLLKDTPKLESLVETPDGVGVVNQIQLLREQVRVVLDQDPDTPRLYHKSEIDIIRNGKGKRPAGYEFPVQPPEKKDLPPRLGQPSSSAPVLPSAEEHGSQEKGRARSLPLPVTKAAGVAAGARGSAGNVLWSSRAGARQSRGLARKSRMAAGPAGTTLSRKGRISRSRLIRLPREKAERNRTSTAAATVLTAAATIGPEATVAVRAVRPRRKSEGKEVE